VPYDSGIVEKMDARTLMELVQQMPAGFRTVFNMYAVEGYSHQEIARELEITESGSRSQLSRAKIWLKEKLKEYNIDG
jgi:RNA polymerase sigma-70 factor (ECF subfamily)